MTQSPIPKVLSAFLRHKVKTLLIGGQASILYGGAEFSRDIDFSVMVSRQNIEHLKSALNVLNAKRIYVPDLSEEVLLKGHACHFRCHERDINGFRIDIISKMRGVDPFPDLWKRRKDMQLTGVGKISVIGLKDLIKAKKTQRDKDWSMIRRLIEADIYKTGKKYSKEKIRFWFSECRTVELLISLASKHNDIALSICNSRTLLKYAMLSDEKKLQKALHVEEEREKELDKQYWAPLKAELEIWRHERAKEKK